MRFQRQTIFGKPNGNCFATCVACLFDLDVDEVPNFCAGFDSDGAWWRRLQQWAGERGYFALMLDGERGECPPCIPPEAVVIASGPAARGLMHSVLYRNGELLWDPHPDGTGIEKVVDVVLFVPRCPGAFALVAGEAA